jgi:hypothetical protein
MKNIKDIYQKRLKEELAWFSLEKYDISIERVLDPGEWAYQISKRIALWDWVEGLRLSKVAKIRGTEPGLDSELIQLFSCPLDYGRHTGLLPAVTSYHFSLVDEIAESLYPQVNLDMSLVEPRHARVQIDLYAGDEAILRDFKMFLANARQSMNLKHPISTHTKLAQWHDNKVIPYMDLLLCQQWAEFHLSESDLIAALFPLDDRFLANRPLKGTKSDHQKVFSQYTVEYLSFIANGLYRSQTEN